MKKFLLSAFYAVCLFTFLGAVTQKVSASFRTDDKSLIIIKKSHQTNGGEQKTFIVRIAGKDMRQDKRQINFSAFCDFDNLKHPSRRENSFENSNNSGLDATSDEINSTDTNERLEQAEKKFLIRTN